MNEKRTRSLILSLDPPTTAPQRSEGTDLNKLPRTHLHSRLLTHASTLLSNRSSVESSDTPYESKNLPLCPPTAHNRRCLRPRLSPAGVCARVCLCVKTAASTTATPSDIRLEGSLPAITPDLLLFLSYFPFTRSMCSKPQFSLRPLFLPFISSQGLPAPNLMLSALLARAHTHTQPQSFSPLANVRKQRVRRNKRN